MTARSRPLQAYEGPNLVYGKWREAGLVVVGEEWARHAADEIAAVLDAKTWGAAKAASDASTHTRGPVGDDLEDLDLDPGGPVETDQIPGWIDGDWPPIVCLYTSEYLPGDWPIGETYMTTFNGDGVVIPINEEGRLVELATQVGATLRRDDALIGRLDPQW